MLFAASRRTKRGAADRCRVPRQPLQELGLKIKRWLPQRLKPTLLPKTAEVAEAVRDLRGARHQAADPLVRRGAYSSAILEIAVGLMIRSRRVAATSGRRPSAHLQDTPSHTDGHTAQNDYKEFWALCDFVCPGELGALSSFARDTSPIDAGAQRVQELLAARRRAPLLTEPFVQRREESLLSACHLPELAFPPGVGRVSAKRAPHRSMSWPTQEHLLVRRRHRR